MRTHNIQFHDKIRKFHKVFVFLSYGRILKGLKNKFKLATINEPSVFKLLKFDCICIERNRIFLFVLIPF